MIKNALKSEFSETLWKQAILSIGVLFSFSIYFYLDKGTITQFGDEDGIVEYLTAVLFFISSLIMLYLSRKQSKIFFLLFLLLFIGAGEEISWGQRLFHIDTPNSIRKINVQGELNLHNIEILNRENFNQSVKKGWRKALTINGLYRIFIFTYGFGLPLIVLLSTKAKSFITILKLPLPPLTIGIYFIISWLFFKFFNFNFPPVLHENTAEELFEMMTSLVWLLISTHFLKFKNPSTSH